MRNFLAACGMQHPLMLPGVLLACLLAWHWAGRHPFRCRTSTYLGVVAESIAFAGVLILFGHAVCLSMTPAIPSPSCMASIGSFMGAGIYEEVLFRLLLLPLSYAALRVVRVPIRIAWTFAIAFNAILFATAHYLVPASETFNANDLLLAGDRVFHDPNEWLGWAFRLTAGIAFCLLFLFRGLAVAVGSHVCYDILVGVVMEHWLASPTA
jgi:hypothetical protein